MGINLVVLKKKNQLDNGARSSSTLRSFRVTTDEWLVEGSVVNVASRNSRCAVVPRGISLMGYDYAVITP